MKQRESGAEYRKRRRIKDDKIKSYPKITGFMNTVDVTPGPAFPTAAAAQTATKELPFFRQFDDEENDGDSESDEGFTFDLWSSDEEYEAGMLSNILNIHKFQMILAQTTFYQHEACHMCSVQL